MELGITNFLQKGKASFITGGMFGSEAKGAAAAWVANQLFNSMEPGPGRFDVITTNAGAQAGHTSIHQGKKRIVFHLPTAALIAPGSTIYLNAGSIIDVAVLLKEIRDNLDVLDKSSLFIHPMAAVITQDCKDAEGRPDSAQTKIASTRKGVGEALARKVLRSGLVAKDCNELKPFVRRLDLNSRLATGQSVLVEVPQGNSLSLNGKFYPHCTSRDCTVGQAASDAGIHPCFVGPVMVVLRTFPIRVGAIIKQENHGSAATLVGPMDHWKTVELGNSGPCYPDQQETSWEALGVTPEITTVTGRVRRVFTWSQQQVIDAFIANRPAYVYLSHCDYLPVPAAGRRLPGVVAAEEIINKIYAAANAIHLKRPRVIWSDGPTTADVYEYDAKPVEPIARPL